MLVYGEAEIVEIPDQVAFATKVLEKYVLKEQARRAAEKILKISHWIKIVVTPKRTASFDYGKDEVWRAAFHE